MFQQWSQSIRFRFVIALIAMLLPLMVLGLTTYLSINRVVDSFTHVVEDPYAELEKVSHTQLAVQSAVMPPNDYLVHGELIERKHFQRLSNDVEIAFDKLTGILGPSHKEGRSIQNARKKWDIGKAQAEKLLEIKNPAGNRQAAAAMERMDAQFESVLAELDIAKRLATEEANEALIAAKKVQSDAIFKAGLTLIVGLILAALSGWLLMNSIVVPIQKLHHAVQQFGRGQLDKRVEIHSKDELGKLAGAFNDMAGQVQNMADTLTTESTHDPLTGILNRREFERQFQNLLEHAIRHNRYLTVAMMDLDHFKNINDEHGHQLGDEFLKNFVRVIENNLRPGDVFARYGGEEFVAILPEADSNAARRVAERMRLISGGAGVKTNGKTVATTVSIGLATFPTDGSTTTELMAASDRALYGAKAAGRDRVETAQEV